MLGFRTGGGIETGGGTTFLGETGLVRAPAVLVGETLTGLSCCTSCSGGGGGFAEGGSGGGGIERCDTAVLARMLLVSLPAT